MIHIRKFVYNENTQRLEVPNIYLVSREMKKKYCLTVNNLQQYIGTTNCDEISFEVQKEINGETVPYWEELTDLSLVYVENQGVFELAVETNEAQNVYKTVSGISLECAELAQLYVNFSVNGEGDKDNLDNWDVNNNYISTVLWNPDDEKHSLLHRLLEKAPHWKVKHVDAQITVSDGLNKTKENSRAVVRTFEFNKDIYSCLMDIASELEICFEFDTLKREIYVYDLNEHGQDTAIYIDGENLRQNAVVSSNKDSIKNCFKVVGGDDVITSYVSAVNPNGSQYIYYFSAEQKANMDSQLLQALEAYENKFNAKQEDYQQSVTAWFNAMDEVTRLQTTMSPTIPNEETTAQNELDKLTSQNIGEINVLSQYIENSYSVKRAVLQVVRLYVDYRYDVKISNESYDKNTKIWSGCFTVKNETNKEDIATSTQQRNFTISVGNSQCVINQIENLVKDAKLYRFYANADNRNVRVNPEILREYLQEYNLDTLTQYRSAYDLCRSTLLEMGWGDANHEFHSIYSVYNQAVEIIDVIIETRKEQIANAESVLALREQVVMDIQSELNFPDFLDNYGTTHNNYVSYKEFCSYIREQEYSNSNYVADGLSNEDAVANAKKLVEVATRELYKASAFQQTYRLNILNFFEDCNYSSIFDSFDVYNWIKTEVDKKIVSLRIIGVRVNYDDLSTLEVEFSEQVKNLDGTTDLQKIIKNSKSMATSYSYTAKQANKTIAINQTFADIKSKGLASALGNVTNSTRQEVTYDEKGILLKSMLDDGSYDPHQMRITGKNIVMTDDGWDTARMAIGDLTVEYDSNEDGVPETHNLYGLIADYLQGDLVLSEEVRVLNKNANIKMDENGLTIYNKETNIYVKINPKSNKIIEVAKDLSAGGTFVEEEKTWVRSKTGKIPNSQFYYPSSINNDTWLYKLKSLSQNSVITVNGINYVCIGTELYTFSNGVWERKGDIVANLDFVVNNTFITSDVGYYHNSVMVLRKELDGYIYILVPYKNKKDANKIAVVKYKISNSQFSLVNVIKITDYVGSDDITYNVAILNNNKLLINLTSSSREYRSARAKIIQIDNTGNELETVFDNDFLSITIENAILYNNRFYVIYEGKKFGELTFSTDATCSIRNIFTHNNVHRYCLSVVGSQIYILTYGSATHENNSYIDFWYSIYDIANRGQETEIKHGTEDLLLNTVSFVTYGQLAGLFMCSDNGKFHLFNMTTRNNPSYRSNTFFDHNITQPCFFEHYVYENKTYKMSAMITEASYSKNFNTSSQWDYCKVGNNIYNIKAVSNYGSSNTNDVFHAKKIAITNQNINGDWLDIAFFNNSGVGATRIGRLIQSNSATKLYLTDGSGKMWCIDTNTDTIQSCTPMPYVDIGYSTFYDETTHFVYTFGSDTFSCNGTAVCSYNFTSISNIVWDYENQITYFVAGNQNSTYKLYSLTYSGVLSTLYEFEGLTVSGDIGFSVCKVNKIINMVYAENGVLDDNFYFYYLTEGVTVKHQGMFKDLGLYTVERVRSGNVFNGCFLPQIAVGNTIHFFVGYGYFGAALADYNGLCNGGYKHYILNTTEIQNIASSSPDVFYITKNGKGYFNGVIEATDGVFRGEVLATSLTLGGDVSFSKEHVTGLTDDLDNLNDSIGDLDTRANNLNETLKTVKNNCLYQTDVKTVTTEVGGKTKKEVTIKYGDEEVTTVTYDDGDYILTDVGMGIKDNDHTYVKISKDGLLEANNAIIHGTVYATNGSFTGTVHATDGSFAGNIVANSGNIGGFAIDTLEGRGRALKSTNFSKVFNVEQPEKFLGLYLGAGGGDIWQFDTSVTGSLDLNDYGRYLWATGGHILIERFYPCRGQSVGQYRDDFPGQFTEINEDHITVGSYTIVDAGGVGQKNIINSTTITSSQVTTNGVALTSDRKRKTNIENIDSDKSKQLILSLNPVTFNFINNANQRCHMGFIAQDVAQTCKDLGLKDLSLYNARVVNEKGEEADYVKDTPDENLRWYLNYNELIAPLTKTVQTQNEQIEVQKEKIENLEERITKLEQLLSNQLSS